MRRTRVRAGEFHVVIDVRDGRGDVVHDGGEPRLPGSQAEVAPEAAEDPQRGRQARRLVDVGNLVGCGRQVFVRLGGALPAGSRSTIRAWSRARGFIWVVEGDGVVAREAVDGDVVRQGSEAFDGVVVAGGAVESGAGVDVGGDAVDGAEGDGV